MEQNIKWGFDDVEAVKDKIYIADYSTGSNKTKLAANDKVSVSGDTITIVFDKMLELKSNSALFVEEGAFRTEDNVNLKVFSWWIVSKPMITGIELRDATLDYTGGLVNGILKGVSLNEADVITAKIFKAGSLWDTNIPVTIGSGHKPSITFELPQNDTELTQSYIINLTMGDTSVYNVYLKKSTDKVWSKVISTTATYYVKKDLEDNVTYNFKIVPYTVFNGEVLYDSSQYRIVNVATKKNIKAPKTVKAVFNGGYDDVKITWKKVSGAFGYYVYMKKADEASYKKIATTSKLTLKKKNLADGVKYTLKIVPYYKNGKTKVAGYYENSAGVYTLKKLAVPVVEKVSSKKVKVSWTNIEGETGYQISRSSKKKGTKVVRTYLTKSGRSKTFKVSKKKKYYYKVRAYTTVRGKKIYGPWSSFQKTVRFAGLYKKLWRLWVILRK